MTCVYASNEGFETHLWTYKNDLHMEGIKLKDEPNFLVKKKGGKNTFIVNGTAQLIMPVKFYKISIKKINWNELKYENSGNL